MIRTMRVFAIFALLLMGCAKKFEIADAVYITMERDKSACVFLEGRQLPHITDFWMSGDCLYGYRYDEQEYILFLIDLRDGRVFQRENALLRVRDSGLPLDRWTNAVELFGCYVSDRNRRRDFLHAVQDFRRFQGETR